MGGFCSISAGSGLTWLWGRYRLGHWPVALPPSKRGDSGDGSVLMQAYVRARSSADGAAQCERMPPVIVGTEEVLREAGGSISALRRRVEMWSPLGAP